MNLHGALYGLGALGMLRLWGALRGFDQFKHPPGASQCVLQLRHHTGNLVKGLGVLVGVI